MSEFLKKHSLLAVLFSVLLLVQCDVVQPKEDDKKTSLHPVLLNGEWGYINNSGNLVIEPRYDEAREFQDGYAAVRRGTTWGYVSESTGELVISPQFSVAGDFSEDLAPAQLPGGQYGFINTNGEFVISASYDFATAFSEGFAAVRSDGLCRGRALMFETNLVQRKKSSARLRIIR